MSCLKTKILLFIFCLSQNICYHVIIHDKIDFELTETEKPLVCGDKKLKAYKVTPPYKAAYFLTS